MAKRFRFRLETLLKLRRQREERCRRAVADRQRAIQELQDRRNRLERLLLQQGRALRDSLSRPRLDLDDLKLSRHGLVRLREGIMQTDAEIALQQAVLAQERDALRTAHQEAKVLDTLKDRQYAAHVAQLQRAEASEQEEMSVLRRLHGRFLELEAKR